MKLNIFFFLSQSIFIISLPLCDSKILRSYKKNKILCITKRKGNHSPLSLSLFIFQREYIQTRCIIGRKFISIFFRIKLEKSDMELIPFGTTSQKYRVTSLYHRLHPINRFYFISINIPPFVLFRTMQNLSIITFFFKRDISLKLIIFI